jgi:bifunctional UDP-N-acetylglucosamine pyrophosphorylase/glucosamine-1-phosphate N-acetyltransferase
MKKNKLAIVILAAGRGTRMKSTKSKVLHEIGRLPMLGHVIKAAESLKPAKIIVVTGPGMDDVSLAAHPHETVIQKSQKGTGDAVKSALPALKNINADDVLILYGDTPLVNAADLKTLIKTRHKTKSGICIAAMWPENPGNYGRVVLNAQGNLEKIIEAKDATPDERQIGLCNAGFMCVDARKISTWVNAIKNTNAQGEYYLTDLPVIAAKQKSKTAIAEISEESAQGVNDRLDLARAERLFQDRRRLEFLNAGVTMTDPATVYFSHDTKIAADVVIEPGVVFAPGVSIESGAVIRAYSYIEGATVKKGAVIGPFARLRPGADIGENVKIGNFVEIKKSKIGKGSKINHLAYVGDTIMGAGVNFGAGAITVNFDGFDKFQTKIEDGVMVGSNANLIAPVTLHNGAFVAAGSTVAEDVPANSLFIGRERPKIRENWAAEFRGRKRKKKENYN